jgi:hypothetical protein
MELIKKIRNNALSNPKRQVKYDIMYDPKWSDDELIKHVIELSCEYNQLTTLPCPRSGRLC